jgi:hypothetical protein
MVVMGVALAVVKAYRRWPLLARVRPLARPLLPGTSPANAVCRIPILDARLVSTPNATGELTIRVREREDEYTFTLPSG